MFGIFSSYRCYEEVNYHQKGIIVEAEPLSGSAPPQRRLSDTIVKAFYQACAAGNSSAAAHLIRALEAVFSFNANQGRQERRSFVDLIETMRRDLLLTTCPDDLSPS